MLVDLVVVTVAFVAMEGVAYATHRWVMHGRRGAGWHVSHHQARRGAVEANDLYPVVMAAFTITLFALGAGVAGLHVLFPTAIGITLYGASYLLVHDVVIHGRLPSPRWTRHNRLAAHLHEAHRIHHLWNGEPYGFLVPVVPDELRDRAATVDRDPLATHA